MKTIAVSVPRPKFRRGFTVVELLVVIAILSLLVSLLVPAVQYSRNASRRMQCMSNLRQMALATHNYVEVFQVLPAGGIDGHLSLLPFLDHRDTFRRSGSPSHIVFDECRIPVFICPSETYLGAGFGGDVSYPMSCGSTFRLNGIFWEVPIFRWDHVRDGLSQTACFSERLTPVMTTGAAYVAAANAEPIRFVWYPLGSFGSGQEDAHVSHCAVATNRTGVLPMCHESRRDLFHSIGYSHVFPPNVVGCYHGPFTSGCASTARVPATSYHTGGVSLALCDGHVRFINNSIDLRIWRALGSRAGGENVPSLSD